MASMTSLNQEIGATTTIPGDGTEVVIAPKRNAEDGRGGFVLRAKSDEVPHRRRSLVERSGMKTFVQGLKLKKQRSTGDLDRKGVTSIRSTGSTTSWMSSESGYTGGASIVSEGSNQSFVMEDDQLDASVTETYMGEWKNDKRSGFGISERSDGLKYEGEWFNNRKYGYGVTTHKGIREEGKYKNNVLVTSNQKRHLFLIRSAKFRERIESAINAAQRASKIALQKADIAISRTATSRGKAEQADIAALHARDDGKVAVQCAKEYAGDLVPLTPAISKITEDKSNTNGLSTLKPNAISSTLSPPAQTNDISRKSPVPNQFSNANHVSPAKPSIQPAKPPAVSPMQPNNNPRAPPPAIEIDNSATSYSEPPKPQQTSRFQSGPPASRTAAPPAAPQVPAAPANPPASYLTPRPSTVVNPTNCDITSDTSQMADRRKASAQLRPQENNFMGQSLQQQRSPRGKSPMVQPQQPPNFRQPNRPNMDDMMSQGAEPSGGYNFQRVMDDHFEHYKRPPSRERSVDLTNLPSSLVEARLPARSSRAPSRNRTPLPSNPNPVLNNPAPQAATTDSLVDGGPSRMKRSGSGARVGATPAPEPKTNGLFNDPLFGDVGGVRYRAPSQEVTHIGAIPKRTESLYLKSSVTTDSKATESPASTLQRKKSLPDVQCLPVVTKSQGSKEMTREEISVLSSSRRENLRRQLEEIERYKSNPILYILSPRTTEWFSRQRLILFILFVNLSLAIMFFKLLT